jgi:uracil-DNA glycosylase
MRRAILGSLAQCLRFDHEEGCDRAEFTAQTLSRIEALAQDKSPAIAIASAPTPRSAPRKENAIAAAKPRPSPPPRSARREHPSALEDIAERIAACQQCTLHETRTRTVPGQGRAKPDIAFIGEAPGADEDRQGLAFVGRAGQLLTKMIEAMGYTRDEVFIANILKCRPPGNRTPTPEEMAVCSPFLREQLTLLRPQVIVTMGATALQGLLPDFPFVGMSRHCGVWLSYEGIPVMPTFHPAYLLYNPTSKRIVWNNLKAVLTRLGKTPPPRK